MSFGIIEVISLLLGLSGFGVHANPNAPSADVALHYAMPEPDVVVHLDYASVAPNYKVLANLPKHPRIKSSPALVKAVREVVTQAEAARGLARGAVGFDFVTDLETIDVFAQLVPGQEPNVLGVVRGKFSPQNIDKLARMIGRKVSELPGGVLVEQDRDTAFGVTTAGILLAGTPSLVRDRLDGSWTPAARRAGSNLAHAAEMIDARPVFAIMMTMSKSARADALASMRGKNFVTDVIERHRLAAFALYHDGVGWSWIDRTKAGLDSMAMMSEGTIELFRAGHIAPRGMAKLMLGALDSYRGTDRQIDDLIRRKSEVLALVQDFTGDGGFKAQVAKNPRALRLDVRLTGKSLSEVVPAGALIALGALGAMSLRDSSVATPPALPALSAPAATKRPARTP